MEFTRRVARYDRERIAQVKLNDRRYNILLVKSPDAFSTWFLQLAALEHRKEYPVGGGMIRIPGDPPFDVDIAPVPGRGIMLKVDGELVGFDFRWNELP